MTCVTAGSVFLVIIFATGSRYFLNKKKRKRREGRRERKKEREKKEGKKGWSVCPLNLALICQ
jgi:hypothetical protein